MISVSISVFFFFVLVVFKNSRIGLKRGVIYDVSRVKLKLDFIFMLLVFFCFV